MWTQFVCWPSPWLGHDYVDSDMIRSDVNAALVNTRCRGSATIKEFVPFADSFTEGWSTWFPWGETMLVCVHKTISHEMIANMVRNKTLQHFDNNWCKCNWAIVFEITPITFFIHRNHISYLPTWRKITSWDWYIKNTSKNRTDGIWTQFQHTARNVIWANCFIRGKATWFCHIPCHWL